ncbi:MAG: hypothetical protein FJX80_06080 [Bacteroidetes bacterium]|nr:hypothetical protein [Bacteroidota bacterium]
MEEPFILKTEVLYQNLKKYTNNHEFECKVWENTDDRSNHVVIMFNGFLEGIGNREDHYEKYNEIGEQLNQQGIVAILLPLPFHFGRSMASDGQDTVSPVSRLKVHGIYLYHGGYTQVKADVKALYQTIKDDPKRFRLTEDFKVSILGYSIGGVSAIAAAKCLKDELQLKLDSLVVVLSAWKIQDIDASSVSRFFRSQLDAEAWTTMMNELETLRENENTDAVFKELIWGEDLGANPELNFEQIAKKVLFIDGQRDDIFNPAIMRERRETLLKKDLKNCTFLSLPVNHFGRLQKKFAAAKYIATFCSL